MAIETKRFKIHEIYNPTKQDIYEDNFEAKTTYEKNTLKIADKERPGETKKFLLYSSSAGPIGGTNRKGNAELYINLTGDEITTVQYDIFGYIEPKTLSTIIRKSQNLDTNGNNVNNVNNVNDTNKHLYMEMDEFITRHDKNTGIADAFDVIADIIDPTKNQVTVSNGGGSASSAKRGSNRPNHLHHYSNVGNPDKFIRNNMPPQKQSGG